MTRTARAPPAPVVAVAIAGITFIVPLGCLAAQALLALFGFAARQNFLD